MFSDKMSDGKSKCFPAAPPPTHTHQEKTLDEEVLV